MKNLVKFKLWYQALGRPKCYQLSQPCPPACWPGGGWVLNKCIRKKKAKLYIFFLITMWYAQHFKIILSVVDSSVGKALSFSH